MLVDPIPLLHELSVRKIFIAPVGLGNSLDSARDKMPKLNFIPTFTLTGFVV